MAFQGDPYRVLGLPPGASLNEIKSAYRRLVKLHHPDAAGERALPRFLAVQAAYELLVDGEGRLRRSAARAAGAARAAAWQADNERARATREAYRARRDRAWSRPPQGASASDAGTGTQAAPGAGGGETGRSTRGKSTGAGRRPTRRATPGSTSYDEAAEGRDPSWGGATWYGPNLGTYWTINPREYADPRKHGPEYAARARRAAPQGDAAPPETASTDAAPDATAESLRWRTTQAGQAASRSQTDAAGSDWHAQGWRFEAEAEPGLPGGSTAAPAPPRSSVELGAGESRFDLDTLASRLSPSGLAALGATGGVAGRLTVALLAWPPLGFGLATLIDVVTGCGGFSAACAAPWNAAPIVLQPLLFGVLFLLPGVAAAAAFAGLTALAVALLTAIALAPGSGGPTAAVAARQVLAGVVIVAYVAGFGVASWRLRTRSGPDASP